MPEKLLTLQEVSHFLGISEQKVKDLVRKGELPAYKIGGRFLRFRREQLEAIREEILAKIDGKPAEKVQKEYVKSGQDLVYSEDPGDRFMDFLYFNNFYIVCGVLAVILLIVIFK